MQKHYFIDAHKLNYHPGSISKWINGENIPPIYVEVGISSVCNHRCIFCALDYTKYKGRLLDTKVLLKALEYMGKNGVKSVMFSGQGEPTLHPDFCLHVKHAKMKGLDVALTTNGIPFTKDKAEKILPFLSWVKFSIDAGTKETYSKIHRTKPDDFDKLMANIKDAVNIRKENDYSVTVGTQLLLIDNNVHEVLTLANKLKEIGVDYLVIKPYSQHPDSINRISLDYDRFKSLKPSLNKLSSDNFTVIFREATMDKLKEEVPYKICYGLPFFVIIDDEGNLVPCHLFHGRKDYYYGNLYKNSFSEIWNSNRRKEIVERIYKEGTADCRENCRLDSVNRYLHDIKNPPEHVNFI